MLNATDIVGHPGGEAAAVAAVRASGLRVTGFQVLRDFEGLVGPPARLQGGHRQGDARDVPARSARECCSPARRRSAHATGDPTLLVKDLQKLAMLAVPLGIRVAYEALSWGRHVNEFTAGLGHRRRGRPRQPRPRARLLPHPRAQDRPRRARGRSTPRKVFLVQLSDFLWQEIRSPEERIETARHFRVFPGEGVHSDQVAELVRALDAMGYRGDYSFEVFNDDYRQLPLAMVAERARRSVKWISRARCRGAAFLHGASRVSFHERSLFRTSIPSLPNARHGVPVRGRADRARIPAPP